MTDQGFTLLQQLVAAQTTTPQRPGWPANPFSPGVRPGSVTDRVLKELRRVAPTALNAGQLRIRCAAARGAIAWAVAYLQARDLIETLSDSRNPLWHRYRARPEGRRDD